MNMARNTWLGLLASLAAVTMALAPACRAATTETQHPFHMGDDIGWMQPSIYHRGLMVGETPNIDRLGSGGCHLPWTISPSRAATAGRKRLFHRHASIAHRYDPAAATGKPVLPAARHTCGRPVPVRSRLYHWRVRQETTWATIPRPFRPRTASRSSGGTCYHLDAMQGVSFPDINKSASEQTIAAPCKNTRFAAFPRSPEPWIPRRAPA